MWLLSLFFESSVADNVLLHRQFGDTPDSAVAVALEVAAAQQGVQGVLPHPQSLAGLLGGEDVLVFLQHLSHLLLCREVGAAGFRGLAGAA